MGITFQLQDGLLSFITTGDVEFDSGLQSLESGLKAALHHPVQPEGGWHLFFDIRESDETRSSADLRAITEAIYANRQYLSGGCAILVDGPYYYAMGRMVATFMESLGLQAFVFSDERQADNWKRALASQMIPKRRRTDLED